MKSDNRNLIAAIAISMMILIVYQIYFIPAPQDPDQQQASQQEFPSQQVDPNATGQNSGGLNTSGLAGGTSGLQSVTEIPAAMTAPRIPIVSDQLGGTVSLAGGRLDDLKLMDYARDDARDENRVELLRKTGGADSYFAEVLFLDPAGNRLVPKDAEWQAGGSTLTASTPLTLTYMSDAGVGYSIEYRIDDNYLITITASAENNSGEALDIRKFARLRRNMPSSGDIFISYEGPIGVFAEDQKTEVDYSAVQDLGPQGESYSSEGIKGWIGITDKYWLVAMIPDAENQEDFQFGFRRAAGAGEPSQVDINASATRLNTGASMERVFHIYAGPKKINMLLSYNESLGVERLDHAIDWGWFPFLTKPFFHALNWLYGVLGNFGLAIMGLTVAVKLAFFPLANKSYHSMAKMRNLSPKIQEMRERYSDDRQRQQQEMMELYRKEKVNPAAGCLPLLLQIPVFFALYKVLFVTIEMRHAPFYGWITDLSALDPTSIVNIFGLLPFSTAGLPDLVNLGVWPILMGITMHVQMSLNPPPPDPVQAKIFKFMPIGFTFLLATFPAGLVIYWTWNNLLSILQQMYIMRSVKKASEKG